MIDAFLAIGCPEPSPVSASGLYQFNLKVSLDALEILKIMLKANHEAQHGFFARFEQRIAFEAKSIEEEGMSTHHDGEDFNLTQEPKDRASIIKVILNTLVEKIQRDSKRRCLL